MKKEERHRQACLPVGRQVSKTLEYGCNGMLWVTLPNIGIKPGKGLGTYELNSASKVSALKLLQPARLCLDLIRVLNKTGLGEPFGKTSLANTVLGSGRFISMRDRSSWTGEGWYRYPSGAWPDEVLERGLSRPLAKRGKDWGRARPLNRLNRTLSRVMLKNI